MNVTNTVVVDASLCCQGRVAADGDRGRRPAWTCVAAFHRRNAPTRRWMHHVRGKERREQRLEHGCAVDRRYEAGTRREHRGEGIEEKPVGVAKGMIEAVGEEQRRIHAPGGGLAP